MYGKAKNNSEWVKMVLDHQIPAAAALVPAEAAGIHLAAVETYSAAVVIAEAAAGQIQSPSSAKCTLKRAPLCRLAFATLRLGGCRHISQFACPL